MRTPPVQAVTQTRRLKFAMAAVWLILPVTASAFSLAELEVTEYSRNSPGASVTFGYFNANDPDLVTTGTFVTPTNDGSGDVFTKYFNRYRDSERVNTAHLSGIPILGSPAPGHSYAKAFGYADAGVDTQGGYTNMGGYARALAGAAPSTGYARTTTEIQFTWVVGPGESGAAVGDTVGGLRWEFGTDGFLTVRGTTWPETTSSYANVDFSGYISRGPGGLCNGFPCPTNTRAAEFDFYAALDARSSHPSYPDLTGTVERYRDWDAWSNTAGSWGEPGAWVLVEGSTFEDAPISRVMGVDTREDLDFIEFDATVGETLKFTATLEVFAAVSEGVGEAEADFIETFSTRIYDPAGRGYDLSFAVTPVPEPANWLFWLAGVPLVWMRRRI